MALFTRKLEYYFLDATLHISKSSVTGYVRFLYLHKFSGSPVMTFSETISSVTTRKKMLLVLSALLRCLLTSVAWDWRQVGLPLLNGRVMVLANLRKAAVTKGGEGDADGDDGHGV